MASRPPARPIALVTGASSGIGDAFARLLAARGHDLVVVARDAERLKRLADELNAAHGVDVEVLPADLTAADQLAAVERRLADTERPIDVLVNNAGYGVNGQFVDLPIDAHLGQIDLNVTAVVRLARAVAPAMVARRSGAILNVSSVAGVMPGQDNSIYSATKAFVTSFSESLHDELAPNGVRVTCLCPGFTRTEFQSRAGIDGRKLPGFLWLGAEPVARAGLDALDRNQVVVVTGWPNKAGVFLNRVVPRRLVRRVAGRVVTRL